MKLSVLLLTLIYVATASALHANSGVWPFTIAVRRNSSPKIISHDTILAVPDLAAGQTMVDRVTAARGRALAFLAITESLTVKHKIW